MKSVESPGTLDVLDRVMAGAAAIRPRNRRDERRAAGALALLDRRTGLEWKRCSAGRQFRAGRCVGAARGLTWIEAVQYADGDFRCALGMVFAGGRCTGTPRPYSLGDARGLSVHPWRLPTQEELLTLVARHRNGRAATVDDAVFPPIAAPTPQYWTLSTYGRDDRDEVWCVDFATATASPCAAFPARLMRLVRLVISRRGRPVRIHTLVSLAGAGRARKRWVRQRDEHDRRIAIARPPYAASSTARTSPRSTITGRAGAGQSIDRFERRSDQVPCPARRTSGRYQRR